MLSRNFENLLYSEIYDKAKLIAVKTMYLIVDIYHIY